jgi:hypothetical protein
MLRSEDEFIELVGELTAYKAAYEFSLQALAISLSTMKEPGRTLAIRTLEESFAERRGELLHVAPPDLELAAQALSNNTVQRTLKALGEELGQHLRQTPDDS